MVLGKNAHTDKAMEGDFATPLGEFYVCAKNPRSKFVLSLCLSYPNAEHAARGLRQGLIDAGEYTQILEALRLGRMPPQHTRLGGEIYIHGPAPRAAESAVAVAKDWTRGCIAVDEAAIRELYALVDIGTPVSISA